MVFPNFMSDIWYAGKWCECMKQFLSQLIVNAATSVDSKSGLKGTNNCNYLFNLEGNKSMQGGGLNPSFLIYWAPTQIILLVFLILCFHIEHTWYWRGCNLIIVGIYPSLDVMKNMIHFLWFETAHFVYPCNSWSVISLYQLVLFSFT